MNAEAWLSIHQADNICIAPSNPDFVLLDWEEFVKSSLEEMPHKTAIEWAQKLRNLANKLEEIT